MKASDLFVRALEAEGARYIFGIPGEENLDMLESLRTSQIGLVLTRHEQAAGFMAATHGRLTGRAGVALSTLGPGATNFVTAAAYAQLGAMPMLMVTGQKPIKTSKQGHFQIVDVVDMMRPLTKYTRQVVSADTIPARVREAFRNAEEERPGAVHLELPEDIARDECEAPLIPAAASRRPIADDKAITRAIDALREAKRPLLMVGAGANRKLTSKMLRRFIDHTGIPFFTTQMGKGVVDEDHPLFLGNAALSAGDFVHRAIDAADCIVNCGHDVVEKPPFFMRDGGRTVIHVNFSSAQVDSVYFPQLEVVGDIANAIWRITEGLAPQPNSPQPHWDFSFFTKVRAHHDANILLRADDERFPMHPARVVAEVRKVMPDDGIACLDNGIYKLWFARAYRSRMPNTLLLDNALATMGAGLPSAIAAKIVHPNRKVLAVCGDGGFMMNSQELETAVRLKLDVVCVILRDDAYGMIRWKQAHMDLPDYGMALSNPDFVKYAESYGARGHRPSAAGDLSSMIGRAFEAGGVHVIDVPVDYSENDLIFNREIRDMAAAI